MRNRHIEDGMGFAGLVPTAAEKAHEREIARAQSTLARKLIEAVEWTGVGNPYEHEPALSKAFFEGATEYSHNIKKRLRDTCKKLGVDVDG